MKKTDDPTATAESPPQPQGRRFRAKNLLVLPQGISVGPGATNMRLNPDEIVTLDDTAAASRFIQGRLRAGDLEEVVERVEQVPVTDERPARGGKQ